MTRLATPYHVNRDSMLVDFCYFDRHACAHGTTREHYSTYDAALKLRKKILIEIEEKFLKIDGVASESAAAALLPRELAGSVGG